MTSDGSGRSQEDLLFVFWAAFHGIPSQIEDWNHFFRKTYNALFGNSEHPERSFFLNWRLRLDYAQFIANFKKVLSEQQELHRVEFALRHASQEKILRLAPNEIPGEIARIEQDVLDRYFTDYLVVVGDSFLRRNFEQQRSAWIREAMVKGLPFLALVATVAISIYAIFAMRRPVSEGELPSGSWLDYLKAFF